MLDLANISIEEVTGRLTAAEDRFARRAAARSGRVTASGELLYTHVEWTMRTNSQGGEGSSAQGCGDGGKAHGKAPKKKGSKPPLGKDQCRRCGKIGHWAKECPVPRKMPKAVANLATTDDAEAMLPRSVRCTTSSLKQRRWRQE
jgi:hypothetical protein